MRVFLFVVFALSSTSLADEPKPRCLLTKDVNLPSAAWLGKRYALTWYGSTEGAKKPASEQKFVLVEPQGELVGKTPRDLTEADGFSSVMGRLRVGPANVLGFTWSDDASGQRTAAFRTLDFTGKPSSPVVTMAKEHLPHGDQTALAWNEKAKLWTLVFMGTEPTERPGYVTHHLYASTFKPGAALGKPVQLDAEESVRSGHSLSVEARGGCVVTAWEGSKGVTLASLCDGKVQRWTVSEPSTTKSPMQATVGVTPSGATLVAWVDEAPKTPTPVAPSAGTKTGAAPSRPWNVQPDTSLPRTSVFFALVDESGAVKLRGRLDAGGAAQGPMINAHASGFHVTWSEQQLDKTEKALVARISPEGNQQGPVMTIGGGWPGPIWTTFAPRTGTSETGLMINHPEAPDCALSWVNLR
ncbi:MAG: hypothetical protein QM817_31990 [Archangium sp.]